MIPNSREDKRFAPVATVGRVSANGTLTFPTVKHIQLDDLKGNAQPLDDGSGVLLFEIGLEGGFHQVGLELASRLLRRRKQAGRIAAARKSHSKTRGTRKEVSQGLKAKALPFAYPIGVRRDIRFVV